MTPRIGLCGGHRTGKTTTAGAAGQKLDIPFVKTTTSHVFQENGLDPAAPMPFSARLDIQYRIVTAAESVWRAESGAFITDRTPIDMMAYTLGDIRGDTEVDANALDDYLSHCFDVTNDVFNRLIVIQPGIPLIYETGKAALNHAYIEHLNTLVIGLCHDERLKCKVMMIPKNMIELNRRVKTVGAIISRLFVYPEISKH